MDRTGKQAMTTPHILSSTHRRNLALSQHLPAEFLVLSTFLVCSSLQLGQPDPLTRLSKSRRRWNSAVTTASCPDKFTLIFYLQLGQGLAGVRDYELPPQTTRTSRGDILAERSFDFPVQGRYELDIKVSPAK